MERQLAAILYADVAGYSRLTGLDEEETHRKLDASLNLLTEVIAAHGGQKIHEAGDAILAEFKGVTAAVNSAVDFQGQMSPRNAELPEDERQKIRDIAMAHSQVLSLHDLRTRSSGVHTFIQLHLELEPEISLIKAHEISDEVEALIRNEFQEAEVIIHQDPYGVEEERANFSG